MIVVIKMERIILHIDVNNAFLSWTAVLLLKQGYPIDIRKIDAVIGGDESKRRGIVLAKSPSAKEKGIYTSETLYSARKKSSKLAIFPADYHWYQKMSHELFQLLSNYSPDIEVFSIDECFLDYGKVKNLFGEEKKFALKLKQEIEDKLGFTVNIGIANNKLCAKMASDFLKPDRVHTLYDSEVQSKMWPLPIGDLFGVGKQSSIKLQQLNIHTIGDLALTDPGKLYYHFKNRSIDMIQSANGIDDSPVISEASENICISNSTTLEHNVTDISEIYQVLHVLSENVTLALRKQNKYTSVIAVQLKDKFFKSTTHQCTLKNPTNLTEEVYQTSRDLFHEMWKEEPIRLIGIRLDHLTERLYHQVSLFENLDAKEQDSELEKIMDQLQEKYGSKIVKRASLIGHHIEKKSKSK